MFDSEEKMSYEVEDSNVGLFVFLIVVATIGSLGNLLVTFIYSKKRDKKTATFFIFVLAFSDLIVCSTLVPITIFMEYKQFFVESIWLCKLFYFMTTTCVPFSCLLMTTIAFDRFFCICIINRKIMNLKRSKLTVLCLIAISCLLGVIPTLASVVVQDQSNNNNNNNNNYNNDNNSNYINNGFNYSLNNDKNNKTLQV